MDKNQILNTTVSKISFSLRREAPAETQKPVMKQKVPASDTDWERHLEEAVALIGVHRTFLFSADIDPDSVGSMLSLALYLKSMGKGVFLVISQGLGDNLDYLEHIIDYNAIPVLRSQEDIARVQERVDAVVFCDTANTKLVPFYPYLWQHILSRPVPVLEIDHHFGADSEKMTERAVPLFRKANATTEIVAELLRALHRCYPEGPNPLFQRNIVLSLITGLVGDTVGGRVVPYRGRYHYWIDTLGHSLRQNTRWRKHNGKRSGDDKETKFGDPDQVQKYLNRLSEEQHACLNLLRSRVKVDGTIETLNLLNSTYERVRHVSRPYHSAWFADILFFLLNEIPENTGKIGVVYFHGKNAEDKECIYIKMRRPERHAAIDLRHAERDIRAAFLGKYMGGGGHPGAVSFRIHPHDETEFLAKFAQALHAIKQNPAVTGAGD